MPYGYIYIYLYLYIFFYGIQLEDSGPFPRSESGRDDGIIKEERERGGEVADRQQTKSMQRHIHGVIESIRTGNCRRIKAEQSPANFISFSCHRTRGTGHLPMKKKKKHAAVYNSQIIHLITIQSISSVLGFR